MEECGEGVKKRNDREINRVEGIERKRDRGRKRGGGLHHSVWMS